nr:integrase, catalytic region, zinc finger, CCHC-type, peptidase aspartic, catalytic [Tanacetum cinerariifolium]
MLACSHYRNVSKQITRNLEGVYLLKGGRSTNLYTINLHEMASASPICLMARASSTKSWLWHQRLSHLNFDTINDLARNDLVVVERRNRTLVEATRTMLIFSRAPLFLWAEAIATAKPDISFLHVFDALCYPKNDREDIGKLGAKANVENVSPTQEPQDVDELNPNAMVDGNTFVNLFATSSSNAAVTSSSQNSRPNGKLIHNSIINGPYVRRMIPEPGDANREVTVTETFYVKTDDELTENELKQIEADDQAIQTILLGSDIGIQEKKAKLFNEWESLQPEWSRHVTIIHQTKDLHTADYTQLYDFLKYNQKEVDELKAERLAKTQDPLELMVNFINPYAFLAPHQDQSSFNQNYMQQPMPNPEDITYPTTAMNMPLALMAKAFKLNYSTPTNNNQRISSNLRNRQIAQPGMNMGQDRQMKMVVVQNPRVQNIGNQNGLIGVPRNANQNLNGNGNLVAARAEGNAAGENRNQIRCYNCRGVDLDEIEEVNANCILMANLQQASTSGTQSDKAPVYDSDGLAEVHNYENYDDKEIFNMFTQEEKYTELLKPISESYQVPQNDNVVISEVTSVEQGGKIVEQHPVNFEEIRALYDSLYQNLGIKVEKVNSVNRKLKETNADLTTELARFKNQKKEQCLSKKINALHLSTGKQIMTLNEQISDLNKQLSKEKSIVSSLLEEKKKLKSDFKTREDKLLDKQIQLEKRIKELNNILVKTGQSIQTIHMLSPKPDSFYHTEQKMALGYQNPFYLKQAQKKQQSLYDGKMLLKKHDPPIVYDSEETLQLTQESYEKIKQLNKKIKLANYTKINHLSRVFVPQTAKSHEELYFLNISKTANVSKSISIPNDDFSDDTIPSVARKFLNEVKTTIVTLQRVVKHRMTIEPHN